MNVDVVKCDCPRRLRRLHMSVSHLDFLPSSPLLPPLALSASLSSHVNFAPSVDNAISLFFFICVRQPMVSEIDATSSIFFFFFCIKLIFRFLLSFSEVKNQTDADFPITELTGHNRAVTICKSVPGSWHPLLKTLANTAVIRIYIVSELRKCFRRPRGGEPYLGSISTDPAYWLNYK